MSQREQTDNEVARQLPNEHAHTPENNRNMAPEMDNRAIGRENTPRLETETIQTHAGRTLEGDNSCTMWWDGSLQHIAHLLNHLAEQMVGAAVKGCHSRTLTNLDPAGQIQKKSGLFHQDISSLDRMREMLSQIATFSPILVY